MFEQEIDPGPSGIGGWLILPTLGLFLTPLIVGYQLITIFVPIFTNGTFETLTTPGSEAFHPLWASLLIFEIISNILVVAFALALIVLEFMKVRFFPALMIAYFAFKFCMLVVDHLFSMQIPLIAEQDPSLFTPDFIGALVGTFVWIPYFLVSKRVKNTFYAR